MKKQKEWICWKLSRDQIDKAAKTVGINPNRLTEKNYEDVVRKFTKEFKKVNRQWELILEDAVETKVGW